MTRDELRHRHERGPWTWWPLAVGAALLGGCGNGSRAADEGHRVTVSHADVHIVGTSESIARVSDLQPAADGRVWVLNSNEPFLVVLGPDGRVEREFGRSGGGPTEFGAPLALVRGPVPADVWVWDLLRHALMRVSTEARLDLQLPRDSLSPPQLVSFAGAGLFPARPWLEVGSGGFLFGRVRAGSAEPYSGQGLWNADVVLVRPDSSMATLEIHTPVADLLGDPTARYPRATKFLPYPIWTVCADATVALYDPLANELRRITPDGGTLTSVGLPQEQRVEVTLDRMFGIAYRQLQQEDAGQLPDSTDLRRQFEAMYSEWEGRSADVFPEYADLRCTRDGTLWLQLFDVDTGPLGRGPNWYRISPNGSRTPVTLPEGFRPFRFETDRIWGTVLDSLRVASVAWIGSDALR